MSSNKVRDLGHKAGVVLAAILFGCLALIGISLTIALIRWILGF
jgi:hypothetical protein